MPEIRNRDIALLVSSVLSTIIVNSHYFERGYANELYSFLNDNDRVVR